jgi:hypothetical protein
MTILFAGMAILITGFWLRMRFHRARFQRALAAMERGGRAQRAAWAFWKVVGTAVFFAAVWLFVEAHA